MEFLSFILNNLSSVIIGFIIGCFLTYLISRLITTAILKAKEEFYEQRSKKEKSSTLTGNKR
jgi:membrane protein DedA with SNARE-associated domain